MRCHSQIRDPVHGFIAVSRKELDILDTAPLQRLRRIRQLAMADLLYPGAVHTRFDHTLGVTHIAGLMCDALKVSEERDLVRQAALLHDIGHGPYSHVSESVLAYLAEEADLPPGISKNKIHELVTAEAILHHEGLARHIAQADRERIVELLKLGYGDAILRAIISGPLDSDKQDYLLRDSYFCGVKYGLFDIHQLHRCLLRPGVGDNVELMVDPEGVHTLEQFVLAKYYLTTQVYRHRVRIVTDQMIIRALILGVLADEIPELGELYRFRQGPAFAKRYLEWDDGKLLERVSHSHEGTRCHALIQRLLQRRLLKRVFHSSLSAFSDQARLYLAGLKAEESKETFRSIEAQIADLIPAEANFTILHIYTIKSVREQSRNDERSILISRDTPSPFEEVSTLFSSIDEKMNEHFLAVFAPLDDDDEARRRRRISELEPKISEIIERAAGAPEANHEPT